MLFPKQLLELPQIINVMSTVVVGILLIIIWLSNKVRKDLVYLTIIMFLLTRAISWMPIPTRIYLDLINFICAVLLSFKLYIEVSPATTEDGKRQAPTGIITTNFFSYGCLIVTMYAYFVVSRLLTHGFESTVVEGILLFAGVAIVGHFAFWSHPDAPTIRRLGIFVTLAAMLYVGSGVIMYFSLLHNQLLFISFTHLFAIALVFALLWVLSWRANFENYDGMRE
ncbi:putative integral membrane protein [Paenibacillus turicensis]|uniref:Integral membrane protein n=1 Tax=Paenibacillus turicensis TaxID=160487 RepID=A0ABS4FSN9_9BACL|nr:putative integral membrane protein [Paenibacillus turicensis]